VWLGVVCEHACACLQVKGASSLSKLISILYSL
jgi:hypothetical protein